MRFLVFVLILLAGVLASPRKPQYGGMELSNAFSPRYYLGDPVQALDKRDGEFCNPGTHSCRDVGFPDFCCSNDRFCIVLRNGTASCCSVERTCVMEEIQPCNTTAYFCHTTSATVISGTTTTTTLDACCPRACSAQSAYLCGEEFGGGCCSFDSACATGRNCQSTKYELPTSIEPQDPSCTTNQHKCDDGGGCCDNGKVCTVSGTVPACLLGTPTGSDLSVMTKDPGLSDAEKAGIAVGVVIGTAGIIGVLTWICLTKRRGRSLSYRNSGQDNMTEMTNDTRSQARPRMGIPVDDLASPVAGPYTHDTPSLLAQEGAVPHQPHHPDDITIPVEMDANSNSGVGSGMIGLGTRATATETPSVTSGTREWLTPGESSRQVYELYGTPSPSPGTDGPSPPAQGNLSSPQAPSSSDDTAHSKPSP